MKRTSCLSLTLVCTLASLSPCQAPVARVPFHKVRLTDKYRAEGANIGDFNKDGRPDVVSGPFWWAGPDFTARQTIYKPKVFPVATFADNFFSFALDVDGDGFDDVLTFGVPGQKACWYQNPKKNGVLWSKHLVHPTIDMESPTLRELVGGGPREILCATGGRLGYLTPDRTSATRPWMFHPITGKGPWVPFIHGLGVGDVDGDGRLDVLTAFGWFEQPKSLAGDPLWKPHPFRFARVGGAQMFAYDIDGDGDNDIVTSLNAHGWGLSWFEHVVVNGAISFKEHVILPPTKGPGMPVQFSQLHALTIVDVDGDGLKDIVTGKTVLAHNGIDPGALDPAVLYWFQLRRRGATATFTPRLIDTHSGVGRQVVAGDVNGDGRPDIVVGNKLGVFVFSQSSFGATVHELSLKRAGKQELTLNAGRQHGNQFYWIFGSATGTSPGVLLGGVRVPLNPDVYTDFALALTNSPLLFGFRGMLDSRGTATASFNVPAGLPALPGIDLHHAFVVFDAKGALRIASNAVPLRLVN